MAATDADRPPLPQFPPALDRSSGVVPGHLHIVRGGAVARVDAGHRCVAATAWIAAVTPALRAYRRQDPLPLAVEDERSEGRAGNRGESGSVNFQLPTSNSVAEPL